MITDITDKLAVVFNVDELCFVPEFDKVYELYGEFALYVLILYAHPASPYASVESKKDRFYLILTDSEQRYNAAQKREMGLNRIKIEDLLGAEMAAAIKKYEELLPTSDPIVMMRVYQKEIARVVEQMRDINLSGASGVKEMLALVQIEKAMTARIESISKSVAKKYMSDKKAGTPSSLLQDIQNMAAASKRKL